MAKIRTKAVSNLRSELQGAGESEGKVRVDISYDIIRHVSAQLYTNPRKAIEELVCNSYDAGATECHVALPKQEQDALIVLDNGKSMDFAGLNDLWMVAKSPKNSDTNSERLENNRLQIGKFGVGKLAAYALGKRLTHVATTKGVTRVVSVGEDQIKERRGGGAPQFNVYKLQASRARKLLEPFLGNLSRPWEHDWRSWTMALVEDVDESNFQRALKIGILRRMISTALPVFKDFTVQLEGEVVPSRQISEEDVELRFDVTKQTFRKKLEAVLQEYWAGVHGTEADDVSPELYKVKVVNMPDPHDTVEQLKAIYVPQLGAVEGWAILSRQSLNPKKLEERGYANNGFAVYTRGKLVNPEDVLFGITPRSHSYWMR